MKYTTLTYTEKLAELEKIADTICIRINNEIVSFTDLIDENNLIFFIARDCIADTDLQSFKLACFDLLEKLNKHFTDTTFYITHADIDTINEYIIIADFETIRNF